MLLLVVMEETGFFTGKSLALVQPVTMALPLESTARPDGSL